MNALRPDQEDALARVEAAFADGARGPLLAGATGFGKTHTSAELIDRRRHAGQTTWFLAHLGELLDDTAARLQHRGVPFGWIRSGYASDWAAPCQLVSLKTAVRRLGLLRRVPPDRVIIDECDLAVAPSYQTILDAIGRPEILGLTGTPIRLDGRPMRDGGFDRLILTPDTIDLIDAGHLSRLRMWSFDPPPELARVMAVGLERDRQTATIMGQRYVIADALGHWRRRAIEPDGRIRPTAVFCSDVASAETTAEEWRRAGFRAMAVHGKSSAADRKTAIRGLREGFLDAVMSADLWIAGVDVDRIACILCLRDTESLRIWLQMVGRGLRKCDEWPDCLLLDCTGNYRRPGIGNPLQRRMATWTLDGVPSARRRSEPLLHVPVCQRCRSCDVVGRKCRECGHEQEIRLPHGPRVIPGELVEIDPRAALLRQREEEKVARQKAQAEEERRCKSFDDFVTLGRSRDYANPEGWAAHKIRLRQRWRTRRAG